MWSVHSCPPPASQIEGSEAQCRLELELSLLDPVPEQLLRPADPIGDSVLMHAKPCSGVLEAPVLFQENPERVAEAGDGFVLASQVSELLSDEATRLIAAVREHHLQRDIGKADTRQLSFRTTQLMDAAREHCLVVAAPEAADAFTHLSERNVDPAVRRQRELFDERLALRGLPEARPAREIASERNGQMIGRSDERRDVGCNAFHCPKQHIAV